MRIDNDDTEISIDVTAPEMAAPVITAIIHNALEAAGFTQVSMGPDTSAPDMEMPQILDMVRENMPDLFAAPVVIYETHHEQLDLSDDRAGALGIVGGEDEVPDPQAEIAIAIPEDAPVV